MSDAQTKLGKLIEGNVNRDAVHIAVAPVIAFESMRPGTHIGLLSDGTATIAPTMFIGIVDPFLESPVKRGQQFYMFLYPNTITDLKHVWTHPAFSDEVTITKSKSESEQWLRNFIDRSDCPSYEDIITAVMKGSSSKSNQDYGNVTFYDGYLTSIGHDASGEIPPEFWDHIEVVTGKKITQRPEYFSCSC